MPSFGVRYHTSRAQVRDTFKPALELDGNNYTKTSLVAILLFYGRHCHSTRNIISADKEWPLRPVNSSIPKARGLRTRITPRTGTGSRVGTGTGAETRERTQDRSGDGSGGHNVGNNGDGNGERSGDGNGNENGEGRG